MKEMTKTKYIASTIMTRLFMYIIVSMLGIGVVVSQTEGIRNDLYGIGDYINVDAVTGMMSALNVVFLFIFVLFLLATRKNLYTKENKKSKHLKEYVKFETILELALTLGYVVVSVIISIFVNDLSIVAGLVVPVYFMYFLTGNLFVGTVLTSLVYIVLIFFILVWPLVKQIKNEADNF